MKIQCPNCNAVYNVSGSKIPDKGTSAKCPECEHRFFVKRPGDILKTQKDKSEMDFESELQLSSVEQLARDKAKTTGPKRARLPYIIFGAVLCLVAIAVIFLFLNQPDFDEGTAALDNHDYVTAIKIFRALAEQGDARGHKII